MVKSAFAQPFIVVTIMMTVSWETEQNKYVGPVSLLMRISTRKDGDFSSYFDEIKEVDLNITTLKETLSDNDTTQAKKEQNLDNYHWSTFFEFLTLWKTIRFSNNFKIKWFERYCLYYFTTGYNQSCNIWQFTTIGSTFLPRPDTQVLFNEPI